MLTLRRDRFPAGIKEYLHHSKAVQVNSRSKCARYMQPIVAVKHVPAQNGKSAYSMCHVSFQSTGSCNLASVNSLKEVQLYVRTKEKGRGAQKRKWGIEMNEGRELYLGSYGPIDKLDQALKLWFLFYITWKWWHSPFLHGKAIGMCMAFQMYSECARGDLDPDWKLDKPMTAKQFRQELSTQMCKYKSSDDRYPGQSFSLILLYLSIHCLLTDVS